MFRRTVWLNEKSDVQRETSRLRDQALGTGVSASEADQLATQFGSVLSGLVDAGATLKGRGSQMSVSRTIQGPGYNITMKFGANERPNFVARLVQAFRRG